MQKDTLALEKEYVNSHIWGQEIGNKKKSKEKCSGRGEITTVK